MVRFLFVRGSLVRGALWTHTNYCRECKVNICWYVFIVPHNIPFSSASLFKHNLIYIQADTIDGEINSRMEFNRFIFKPPCRLRSFIFFHLLVFQLQKLPSQSFSIVIGLNQYECAIHSLTSVLLYRAVYVINHNFMCVTAWF